MCLNKYEQWVEILWVLIRDISMKIMREQLREHILLECQIDAPHLTFLFIEIFLLKFLYICEMSC